MFEVVKFLIFALPLGIFITCALFLLVIYSIKVRKLDLFILRILAIYNCFAALTGLLFFTFYYIPDLFAQLDILYSVVVICTMISFHHFLYFATQSGERFNKLHYIIPTLTCLGMIVFKLLFPQTWEQQGNSVLFVIMLLWGITYSLFPLYEIHIYQLKQSVAAGNMQVMAKSRAALFVGEVFLFPVVFVIFPFNGGQQPSVLVSILLMLSILLALTMNIPLVYAIIRHYTSDAQANSLFALVIPVVESTAPIIALTESKEKVTQIIEPKLTKATGEHVTHKPKRNNKMGNRHLRAPSAELDKKMFDAYVRIQKPYLNPNLTIYDVAEQLESNRTYISKFINVTYRMNFSSYVNRCRLREMNRLLAMPQNNEKSMNELIGQTGFGTYRNYLRAKKQFTRIKKKPDSAGDNTSEPEPEPEPES